MTKEKLINWICNDYITNIKHNNSGRRRLVLSHRKKHLALNNMSLEELKNLKKKLT
jgi:hypothetical protein